MQESNIIEQVESVVPTTERTGVVEESIFDNSPSTDSKENVIETTSYGKFKSAECLYEAYNHLEKEFTKKSQKLRTYQDAKINVEDTVKNMISVNPSLASYADLLSEAVSSNTNSNVKIAECLLGKVNEPCNIINDQQFLRDFVYNNDCIRGKIIAEYVDELESRRSPLTINGKGHAYVSPANRPNSLKEASRLAQQYIENRRI